MGISSRTLHRITSGAAQPSLDVYLRLNQLYQLTPIGDIGKLTFVAPYISNKRSDFDAEAYIASLEAAATMLESSANLAIYSYDLPIFYFLEYPILTKLKLRFFQHHAAPHTALSKHLLIRCKQLYHKFNSVARREIWSDDPLRTFTHQLSQLARNHQASRDQVADAFQALHVLRESLYHSLADQTSALQVRSQRELTATTSYTITREDESVAAFMALDNPGFASTSNQQTTNWVQQRFESAWQSAAILSENERSLNEYFANQAETLVRRESRWNRKL